MSNRTRGTGRPLAVLSEHVAFALTSVPWNVRIESAGDVGLLAMTLEQLCLLSVPEADIAELVREFDQLVHSIDAIRRGAGDEDRHRRFRELRVTVAELEGSVDQLVALLTRCAGRSVSRGELIAEFRATQMSHKLAELDNQLRTSTTAGDHVVGGSAIQAVNAVRAWPGSRSVRKVDGARVSAGSSQAASEDAGVDHFYDPRELAILEEDERRERRTANRFRTGAITSPLVGVGAATYFMLSQDLSLFTAPLVSVPMFVLLYVARKCDGYSRLHRLREERARRRWCRIADSVSSRLPHTEAMLVRVEEARAWYGESHAGLRSEPSSQSAIMRTFLGLFRRDGQQ